MRILRYRPLFACCGAFMMAAALGLALSSAGRWIALGLLLLGGLVCLAVALRRRGERYRSWLAALACLMAALALFQSHLTFCGVDMIRLREAEHRTVTVEGLVTDRRGSGGNLSSFTLSLTAFDGEPMDGKALLTCHYVSDLQPGHQVSLEATVISLSEAAGEGYDATALLGDGYTVGLVSETEETVTVTGETASRLSVAVGALRRSLAARLELLAGRQGEGLPSALLLGDRTALSDTARRDFARAGVSHLLAVSGLHVTLLFGIFAFLLGRFGIPKALRAVLLSLSGLGYLVLLGFPPSATRAVIMLGCVYLSSLMGSRADPLTSLGIAGALILAVSPCAVADAGFWMSFLATLGLITVMPAVSRGLNPTRPQGQKPEGWHRLKSGLRRLTAALLVGVVAMSFTLSVVAAAIGEMGILSPLATVLMTPLCAAVLILSLLALALMPVGLGGVPGWLVGKLCALMAAMAEGMGKPSFAVVSLRHPAILPVAVIMVVAVLALLIADLPPRRRGLILLPLLVGWVTVGGILGADALLTRNQVEATYLQPSTQSDALVLVSGSRGFICDLSNGSLSSLTASALEAERQGATEIAALMLTHYHSRTPGALLHLLRRETVRTLWLPEPENGEDYYLLLACLEKAELAEVPVCLYTSGEELAIFGQGTVTLETAWLTRSAQPVLLVSMDFARKDRKETLLYCGSSVFESDLAGQAAQLTARADTVIFGSHGPLFKEKFGEELDFSEAERVLLSRHGDTAAWFAPARLPDETELWTGPRRFRLDDR